MNPRIGDLRDLSATDVALRQLGKRREGKAEAVRQAAAELARAEGDLAGKREEARNVHKDADSLDLDVRSAEEQVAKLEGQRNTAKSNKEYEIFTREIAEWKEKVSAFEDEALARLERTDELAAEVKAAEERLGAARAALESAEKEVARAEAALTSEEAELSDRRGEIVARIDPDDLAVYDRILQGRGDRGIVPMKDGVCSACFAKLRPQMQNTVEIGQDLVQCPTCNRLLCADETQQ